MLDEKINPPSILATARDVIDFVNPIHLFRHVSMKGLPRGDGHSVLIIPGMACPDFVLAGTRRFCNRLGYDAQVSGFPLNIGPTPQAMAHIEKRLFELNDKTGRRVSIIGKSLGGLMAKELAKQYPDRVRRLILVCAPIKHPFGNHLAPFFYGLMPIINPQFSVKIDTLNLPAPMPTTALYTKNDGLINWRSCVEKESELADNIEVPDAYHTTAGSHPMTLRIIAHKLAVPDTR